MAIDIIIPDATLKARARAAYTQRCIAQQQATAEQEEHTRQRAVLLLEDLMRTVLGEQIDVTRAVVDRGHVRVTTDGGFTFLVLLSEPETLYFDQSCNRCHGRGWFGHPAERRRHQITSLADFGAVLAEPFICWGCEQIGRERRAAR